MKNFGDSVNSSTEILFTKVLKFRGPEVLKF